ncbi:MAG: hypothetical protein A3K19_28835 [Lentisphaerae bacterium RIFOXYB12_FULL_65_16]|nr:MAG: hypothetical protein A3K18_25420 [Lentisphaerae bacterium RIFOXYA12_64_32]OGV88300.1 MAG: hypothetical protein A3K19_28835 [Lentisphaerae bacterium RIFOXYB12_FULL_65_16]
MSVLHRNRLLVAVHCMVPLLGCAAFAQSQIYWGDVHMHTTLSDGKGDIDEVLTYARDVARLDFAIVTDHDFGSGAPWRMSKETWDYIQEKVDAYTVPGKFVAIAGYEWTSQAKYWTEVGENVVSERLFPGRPKFYNHKNVYFPSRVDLIFSAKDVAYESPDLLAEAVQKAGGLIQNNHPGVGPEERDQWGYSPSFYPVIANTEMGADTTYYNGKSYESGTEKSVRDFLNTGGRTGFVKGTDTHGGKPAARTAVFAKELTRDAIFEALRNRRNYAVFNARIGVDFRINGHGMGEAIDIEGKPQLTVGVRGTAKLREVAIIRDGAVLRCVEPEETLATFAGADDSFGGSSYYYLRVTQADADEHGNLSQAWTSPIWVKNAASERTR